MKKSICFSIVLLLSFVLPAFSATLEVGTGKTYTTIQSAIDAASSGDTISVYPGTYTENLTLTTGLTIQSTAGASTTIIDGDASGSVVTMASTCTLDGFTIQNGSGTTVSDDGDSINAGAGIFCLALTNVTVQNCTITNNSLATDGFDEVFGAGMVALATTGTTISNCTFSDNSIDDSDEGTAGFYASTLEDVAGSSSSTVSDCVFDSNSGIGLLVSLSSTISGCTFSNNTGSYGGVLLANGTHTITNCLFYSNSTYGLALNNQDIASTYTITNCTFANNTDTAIYLTGKAYTSTATIKNCIIYGNGGYGIAEGATMKDATPINCNFYNNTSGHFYDESADSLTLAQVNALSGASGNIAVDPLFTNASGNDYTLQEPSPCIDAGISTGAPTEDILGITRPQSSGFDIGCYENDFSTWYFAEGNTHSGFDEWLLIQNVDTTTESDVTITYYNRSGETTTKDITVGANSRYSENVPNTLSSVTGFSGTDIGAKVVGTGGNIKVTRSMYWGSDWSGAHSSKGITSLGTTLYLVEGSTNGFDEYILILNPNSSAATVTMTYYTETGKQIAEPSITVPANSRYTVKVNDYTILNNLSGLSCKLVSTEAIAVERAMYKDTYGHCTIATAGKATTWYFAEGCTAGNFTTFLLLLNDNSSAVTATITFYKDDGTSSQSTQTINANTRKTINLADIIPNAHFATKILATGTITAERAMYWENGAHCSLGETTTATTWYLPEGSTANSFTNYVLVNNSGTTDATLTFTFMKTDGTTETATETVVAGSRKTIDLSSNIDNEHFSTKIVSTEEIMIERAMYWNNGDGHCSSGGRR